MILNILYFNKHKDQLSKVYIGRFLVIKDEKVVGDFRSWLEACTQGLKIFNQDNFLVKYCS